MKLAIKVVILQLLWFFAVIGGPRINDIYIAIPCFLFVICNYIVYRPTITPFNYFLCIGAFCVYGLIQDFGLFYLNIIELSEGYYPFWLLSLYLIFIGYYGDVFNYLQRFPVWVLSILGGTGGAFAYFGGMKFDALSVAHDNLVIYILVVFAGWAVFFPFSFYLFNRLSHEKIRDTLNL